MNKKFMIRHNLNAYSEEDLARKLDRHGYQAFFPFRDKGIDILAARDNKVRGFQVKARTANKYGYWFALKEKDVKKTASTNMYWAFGMVRHDYGIDFIIIPSSKLEKWITHSKVHKDSAVLSPDKNNWWLKIEKEGERYVTLPRKGSIDVTTFLFDNWIRK